MKRAAQTHVTTITFNERLAPIERHVTATGLNADGKKVTNVADGTIASGSKDAINGGQLFDAMKANQTDWSRIHRMGAMNTALAGLHPMEYDERHKVSVSMAYGNYHNGNAIAAGVFMRPDHRSMISAGLAFAKGGDTAFNIGGSWRVGAKKNEYASTFKDFASSEVAHQLSISVHTIKAELLKQKASIKAEAQTNHRQDKALSSAQKRLTALEAENKALRKRLDAMEKAIKALSAK